MEAWLQRLSRCCLFLHQAADQRSENEPEVGDDDPDVTPGAASWCSDTARAHWRRGAQQSHPVGAVDRFHGMPAFAGVVWRKSANARVLPDRPEPCRSLCACHSPRRPLLEGVAARRGRDDGKSAHPRAGRSSRFTRSLAGHTAFSSLESASNPFAQRVDRGRVLAAMHRSDRLKALARQVFRPLAWQPNPDKGEEDAHDIDIDD